MPATESGNWYSFKDCDDGDWCPVATPCPTGYEAISTASHCERSMQAYKQYTKLQALYSEASGTEAALASCYSYLNNDVRHFVWGSVPTAGSDESENANICIQSGSVYSHQDSWEMCSEECIATEACTHWSWDTSSNLHARRCVKFESWFGSIQTQMSVDSNQVLVAPYGENWVAGRPNRTPRKLL